VQEVGRGGLPGGAGHGCDVELAAGIAEERHSRGRHRAAGVRDEDLLHGNIELALHDECHSPARNGFGGELVPVDVRAANAEEQRSGGDRA
jgi:hypothetical protein